MAKTRLSLYSRRRALRHRTHFCCTAMTCRWLTEHGSCPLRIRVPGRYGIRHSSGENYWRKICNRAAVPLPEFEKGNLVWHTTYGKGGSAESRDLRVFEAKDGSNLFILEANPGGTFTGDNVDISRQVMAQQVSFNGEGFTRRSSSTGASKHQLFIKTI